jgi:hypothetical protein
MSPLKKKSGNLFHSQSLFKMYLVINLTNNIKGLYKENYQALENVIVEDTGRWKDLP